MSKSILSVMAAALIGFAAALTLPILSEGLSFDAQAEGVDLLRGCGDIPEVVALTERLNKRALRVDRYLQELERKRQEIKVAEADLHKVLMKLSEQRNKNISTHATGSDVENVGEDITRLISVYDQMKPDQAAGIIENLPPEFSAEILMRIQPENSAKIMASVNVNYAAILTSYMGARHARK